MAQENAFQNAPVSPLSINQALLKKSQSQEREGDAPERTGVNIMRSNRIVFLQLVQVKVSNQNGDSVETYALLDSGSECTIITKGLCVIL